MTKHTRRITEKQFLFTVFCFLQASPLFQTLLFAHTAQESWLAVIVAVLIGLLATLPILFLYRKNRGNDLTGICRNIFGKVLGTVVGVLYLLFFLLRLCANIAQFGGFISTNMLQRTPIIVISTFFIVGAILCARRGAENLCGMALIFSLLISTYIILSALLLTKNLSISNLLPVFSLKSGSYVKAIMSTAVEPFANLVIFLMLFDENERQSGESEDYAPGNAAKKKSISLVKAVIAGYLLSALILIISVFRDNALFGEFSKFVTATSFQAARLISVGEVLSRMEIVFAVIFVTTMLFKAALSLYCVSKLLANLTGAGGSTKYVLPFGILMCGLSLIMFKSHEHMEEWSFKALPFYNWIFEIIIPLIMFVICLIQIAIKKKKGILQKSCGGSFRKSASNKDGKKLYIASMIIACVVTGAIFVSLFAFNFQFPSPLEPAKRFAEYVLGFFVID